MLLIKQVTKRYTGGSVNNAFELFARPCTLFMCCLCAISLNFICFDYQRRLALAAIYHFACHPSDVTSGQLSSTFNKKIITNINNKKSNFNC